MSLEKKSESGGNRRPVRRREPLRDILLDYAPTRTIYRLSPTQNRFTRVGIPAVSAYLGDNLPHGTWQGIFVGVALSSSPYVVYKAYKKHEVNRGRRDAYEKEKQNRDTKWKEKEAATFGDKQTPTSTRLVVVFDAVRNPYVRYKDRRSYVKDPQAWKNAWDKNYFLRFVEESPFINQGK